MTEKRADEFIDDGRRGVNYTRKLRVVDASGANVPLEAYTILTMAVEIIVDETGDVLRPGANTYRAAYDEDRGGAAEGAITVFILGTAFELGWQDEVDFNTIRWSVKGGSATLTEESIFNCELTVRDTAFA